MEEIFIFKEESLSPDYTFNEYMNKFCVFLERRNLRKTYERSVIAQAIYKADGYFTMDSLQKYLKKRKHIVSKATLYNTISLLIECELITNQKFFVKKTHLSEKDSMSECKNHIHNESNGNIIEFSDSRIEDVIKELEKRYDLKATRHTFIVYCNSDDDDE